MYDNDIVTVPNAVSSICVEQDIVSLTQHEFCRKTMSFCAQVRGDLEEYSVDTQHEIPDSLTGVVRHTALTRLPWGELSVLQRAAAELLGYDPVRPPRIRMAGLSII